MNERIIDLANEANKDIGHTFKLEDAKQLHELMEKFAELIIQEHLHIMKTEWYELNNRPVNPEGESPRDVGMRVGRKTEVIALMNKVEKHFGVKE